ncbi:MAG: sigma-54-dependent Fis family transcriptional regulator [Elusimicrobia bacterium]|nr:sigma-54-dependent Fis family transcriptional regulator [Elusimicrobiota bacterium]
MVVADIKMPGLSGIELLKTAKTLDPALPVILITAFPEFDLALEALRAGAKDFLVKPFHPDDFTSRVHRALEEVRLKDENKILARHIGKEYMPTEIVGQTPEILKLIGLVDKVAPTPADVLILGESGTGKELIARRLHVKSGRRGHFVPVDCGAIPENLLENEFFGHERGAYTDASRAAPGLMELADGGTFFLDEICELPGSLQAKLLRALQERQIRRVGGTDIRSVDIRIVAATNRDPQQEVKAGRFREDLYYRLNVININLPPLRERIEDVPLLARHYLPRICKEMNKPPLGLDESAAEMLMHYQWPGNIRELQNVLKTSVVLCSEEALTASDLPELLVADSNGHCDHAFTANKKKHVESFEKGFFESLLKHHKGNVRAAVDEAGIPASSFYWYLKKYQLNPQSFRG